jgi:hypothetical protein
VSSCGCARAWNDRPSTGADFRILTIVFDKRI